MPEHDPQNAANFNPADFHSPPVPKSMAINEGTFSGRSTGDQSAATSGYRGTLPSLSTHPVAAQSSISAASPPTIRTAAQTFSDVQPVLRPTFAPPLETGPSEFSQPSNVFNFSDQTILSQLNSPQNVEAPRSFAPPADRSTLPFVPRDHHGVSSAEASGFGAPHRGTQTFEHHVTGHPRSVAGTQVNPAVGVKTKLVDLRGQSPNMPQPASDQNTRSASSSEFLSRDAFSNRLFKTSNSVSDASTSDNTTDTESSTQAHASGPSPRLVVTPAGRNEVSVPAVKTIFLTSGRTADTKKKTETSPQATTPQATTPRATTPKATLLAPTFSQRDFEVNKPAPPTKDPGVVSIKHTIPDFVLSPPHHVIMMDNPLPPAQEIVAKPSPFSSTQNHFADEGTDTAISDGHNGTENGADVLARTGLGFTEDDFLAFESQQNSVAPSAGTNFSGRYVNQINPSNQSNDGSTNAAPSPFRVANHRRSVWNEQKPSTERGEISTFDHTSANGYRGSETADRIILPKFRLQQSDFAGDADAHLATSTTPPPVPQLSSIDPAVTMPWLSAWWMLIALIPFALYLGTTKLFRDSALDDHNDFEDNGFDRSQPEPRFDFGSDFGVVGRSKSDAIYGDADVISIDENRFETIDQGFTIPPATELFEQSLFFEMLSLDKFKDGDSAKEISADQSPNFGSINADEVNPRKKAS